MDANVNQDEKTGTEKRIVLLLWGGDIRLVSEGGNVEKVTMEECAAFGEPDLVAALVWRPDNAEAR